MEMDGMEKPAEQRTRFSFKCSFLELYNETITDLLRPSSVNLQVRPAAVSVAVSERGVAGVRARGMRAKLAAEERDGGEWAVKGT